MNKQTEALKMAIEALQNIDNWLPTIGQRGLRDYEDDALQACKEALEQPAQEPVALIFPENRWYIPSPLDKDEKQIEFNRGFAQGFNDCILHVKLHNQKPLYTHPAPSWKELSHDELDEIVDSLNVSLILDCSIADFVNAIEARLKEKNN